MVSLVREWTRLTVHETGVKLKSSEIISPCQSARDKIFMSLPSTVMTEFAVSLPFIDGATIFVVVKVFDFFTRDDLQTKYTYGSTEFRSQEIRNSKYLPKFS